MTLFYPPEIEELMVRVYQKLSERDRRLYSAVEAEKLPHGGKTYIANLFGCSRETLYDGIDELHQPDSLPDSSRIRRPGAGAPKAIEKYPQLEEQFLKIVSEHTAGSPQDEKVKWTYLKQKEICQELEKLDVRVSVPVVKDLLKKHNYRQRKMSKQKAIGQNKYRDQQFKKIARLKKKQIAQGEPLISIDTKKKEKFGELYREGKVYGKEAIKVYDHDFPSLATGVGIPYGIYDLELNKGYLVIGLSHDTCEFAVDSLKRWWFRQGKYDYQEATQLLILADGGGSNSSRSWVFKEKLQEFATQTGLEIRVAHYPPYTSKWNPIEHRLFPHVSRAIEGIVLGDQCQMRNLIEERAKTKTGLEVKASIIEKVYQLGKRSIDVIKDSINIVFDKFLGFWNYTIFPRPLSL